MVFARHVVNQFHNQHGFADARAAEQTHLAALHVRGDQVHHFNAGFKQFRRRVLVLQGRRFAVNGHMRFGVNGAAVILRLAQHVHQSAQAAFAHGHFQRCARVTRFGAALQAVGAFQRHTAHNAVAHLLGDFRHDDFIFGKLYFNGVFNSRQMGGVKLYVHGRADYLAYFSGIHVFFPC